VETVHPGAQAPQAMTIADMMQGWGAKLPGRVA